MNPDNKRKLQLHLWKLEDARNRLVNNRFLFLAEVYLLTSSSNNWWIVKNLPETPEDVLACHKAEIKYEIIRNKDLIERKKSFLVNFKKAKRRIPYLNKMCGLS